MICNLSTMMGKFKYSIQDVRDRTGLSRSTISALYHDTATRIDYVTIEKLCALFNCEINEMFELENNKHEGN